MHRRHSDYPISILIHDILDHSGLKVVDFVRRIGYSNVSKGIRRLDHWLRGWGSEGFISLLTQTYPEKKEEVDAALDETIRIMEEEWEQHARASFRPYLRGRCEIEPRRFLYAMHYDNQTRVALPQGPISFEEVSALVREHWELRGGAIEPFGRIVRYEYGVEYGRLIILDILGRKIGEERAEALEPQPHFALV